MAATAGIPIRRRVSGRPQYTSRAPEPECAARNCDPAELPGTGVYDKQAELRSVGQIIELGARLQQAAFWRIEVVMDDRVELCGD